MSQVVCCWKGRIRWNWVLEVVRAISVVCWTLAVECLLFLLANGGRRRADNQFRRHRRLGFGPVLGRVLDVPHGPDGRVDVTQYAQSFFLY